MTENICNNCGCNYIYKDGKWVCPGCGAYKQEEMSNPANRARSSEEIDSVRPMIDAARAKLTGSAPVSNISNIDISSEINAEKNRVI